jgi:hypothetical protein
MGMWLKLWLRGLHKDIDGKASRKRLLRRPRLR